MSKYKSSTAHKTVVSKVDNLPKLSFYAKEWFSRGTGELGYKAHHFTIIFGAGEWMP